MRQLDVGPLPVCDGEQLIGMLTDRNITVRAVAEGCDPKTTAVREAMTPDIAYCPSRLLPHSESTVLSLRS